MLESPVRVALLARPGEARDQLRRALTELGARLVAEGDPAELDPGQVAGENPSVVLVSLEPAIEDSLERFQDLLGAPGIEVMYDDAEVTRLLDGWDLARWARHLAAKLMGGDLLPPAPGGSDFIPDADLQLEPGAPRTPAQEMADEKLEDYAAESLELSEWVPTEPSLASGRISAAEATVPGPEADAGDDADALLLDIDLGGVELAMEPLESAPEPPDLPTLDAPEEDLAFDETGFDIDLSALPDPDARMLTLEDPDTLTDDNIPPLADLELEGGPVSFSSFTDEEAPVDEHMDDNVAALAAQLDAYEAQGRQPEPAPLDLTSHVAPESAAPETPSPPEPEKAAPGFGSLELMPMDGDHAGPAAPTPPPLSASGPVAASVSRLSLAESGDGPIDNRHAAPGAVLVIAGLGGPDAVRQLLAALPPTLPVPVLLYQHLDTGKHDRLLSQLAKASRMPLDLAAEGKRAFAGRVGVLPPGVGVSRDGEGFRYSRVESLGQVPGALPAGDSAVLLLSGADPDVVPAVLALHAAGAMVLAQDPDSCFDAVAAGMLIDAGATSASPAELARLVIERWS